MSKKRFKNVKIQVVKWLFSLKGLILFAIFAFLITHFVNFSISYKLKTLVLNIWEPIFDKRRGRSPPLLLKMLRWSVALSFMELYLELNFIPF